MPEKNSADKENNAGAEDCVVVAVGASAGGLNAFKEFLSGMPSDTGMAFVFLQHLDPTHESLMSELLSKYTAMPVLQVNTPTAIQPDHVYMIPPNKFLRIQDGGLFLDESITKRGVRLPIDYFFSSLAQARGERAICVVLSGTGSDGAEGVREVKASGGMTLAQSPNEAEYDGMPRAAIQTDNVDFVLTIQDMAEVIVPFSRHPYVKARPDATLANTSPDHFRAIISLLRAHTDQDFSRYKKGTLTRRIERRMGVRHIHSAAEYLALLRDDGDELRQLFKDLLIGVTRFFRDDDAWKELTEVLETAVQGRQEDAPFRIWIPGCSTGEEAYSLAIMLSELSKQQGKRLDVQIFATDIDADAIETARAGKYPENITRDINENLLDLYFDREGDRLRVKKRLREHCIFAVQNVLSDPPFSNLDLISCRNLLIYLESDVQARVFELMHFALRDNGLLFLGSSESPAKRKELFRVLSQSARIYRKRGPSRPGGSGYPVIDTQRGEPIKTPFATDGGDGPALGTMELTRRALLDEFAPASVVVTHRGEIQYIHGQVRHFLNFPSGEPDLNLAALAQDGLKGKIRSALQQAHTSGASVTVLASQFGRADGPRGVRLQISPLPRGKSDDMLYLVSFIEEDLGLTESAEEKTAPPSDTRVIAETSALRRMELELQATREDLQSTIEELESSNEELKASNEEVMSMNEELQSTNEELETSREELQSLNEELSTVNNQLHDKVQELEATTDDLTNLLSSTELATIFLDQDLHIRRFTPATYRLMHIIDSDIGRPVSDLTPRVEDPHLVDDARAVLETLLPKEREVRNEGGRIYARRITPFRTSDNKIEGAVVVYNDVTALQEWGDRCQRRELQQAAIAQLGKQALAAAKLDELFQTTCDTLAQTLHIGFANVMELDSAQPCLRMVAGTGWVGDVVGSAELEAGSDSLSGFALASAAPVIVSNLSEESRFSQSALLAEHNIASGISVAIGPDDAPWGVLGVYHAQANAFTPDDANFVVSAAYVLWEAIQRTRTEANLRDRLSELDTIYDSAPVGLAAVDTDMRYLRINKRLAEMNGATPEAHLGRTTGDMVPGLEDIIQPIYRQVMENGEPALDIEINGAAPGEPDVEKSWILSLSPIRSAGEVIGAGCFVMEQTEARKTALALQQSEARLRLAARLAGFGTFYYDFANEDEYWSPELTAMLESVGIDSSTERASGLLPALSGLLGSESLSEGIQASLEPEGNGEFRQEIEIERTDGERRWILIQGSTMFEEHSGTRRPSQVAGVAIDITARHRVEDELRDAWRQADAANEAKSIFLANMSHEIRTPMTAILGYADVLDARLEDEDAKACVNTIKENGDFLCDILNDILDLSKIESGKIEVQKTSCAVAEILAEIRSLMAVRASEKGLALSLEFEGGVPERIRTDPRLLRQVLVNLVGNAIKFTNNGSVKVITGWSDNNDTLTFSVVDTGVGIAEEEIEKLFEPFEQLDNSLNRASGGSGLGLAISRRIAHLLGGALNAYSVPGAGSTFVLTISQVRENAPLIHPDPDALRRPELEIVASQVPKLQGCILVAEDRSEIRLLIETYLESSGAEIIAFPDGQALVDGYLMRAKHGLAVDAILMDLQMPVMDGMQATTRLRTEGFKGSIVALTANVLQTEREKCLRSGFDDFIPKPIDPVQLVTTLAHRLSVGSSEGRPGQISVLCVEDSYSAARAQQMLLEARGYVVQTATSGEEAMAHLKQFTADVVLIDLGLPDTSGEQLLRQIKAIPKLASCKYLCVTGRSESDVDWRALGFDAFLAKPAGVDKLEREINRVLETWQQRPGQG